MNTDKKNATTEKNVVTGMNCGTIGINWRNGRWIFLR
jgi:hypothetical protein